MASAVHVVVVGDTDPRPVVDLLEHLEASWSRFRPDSDISRLARHAGEVVSVNPSTVALVDAMIHAWRITDGAFDPTVLPDLVRLGYASSIEDPRRVTILPGGLVAFDGERPTLDDVVTDAERSTVRIPRGLALDPGGLGKGLAADLAVQYLLAAGARGALVGVGGDLAIGGDPLDTAAGGWPVDVDHPAGGDVGTIVVSHGGVATSSTRSRRWLHDGTDRHHVIDPVTHLDSTTDLASATVVARSGWLAEAHATAALLAGSSGAVQYLERHGLTGVVVADDGSVSATADLPFFTPVGAQ
jgi:thiamine biosynthesis lipoprotein